MPRPRRLLVPVLALLVAGCGDSSRLAPPPPPEPSTGTALPPAGPFVRVLSPQAGTTTLPAVPEPSLLDRRRLDLLHLEDVPLEAACQLLTRLIGTNIVASAAARPQRISLFLSDVPARSAIEGLCRLHGLWYREDPGMVRLLTAAEYGGELVIRHEDETRLYYLRNASAVGVAELISALMPGQIAFNRPAEESSFGHVGTDGDDPMSSTAGTANSKSGQAGIVDAAVQRQNYGTPQANAANGPPATTPAQAVQVAQQEGSHDGKAVGSRALAARGSQRGSAVVSVFLRNNCVAVRAVDETLHREIGQLVAELDTPTRQVLLEVKVLRVALRNGFESFFNIAYQDGGRPRISASFLNGAQTTGNTVSFSLLDSKISAAMHLLQTDGRMHAIATPMLLSANNAPAEFFSGVTRMITTNYDYETRYSENGVATDIARPVVVEREIGTQVRIKPSINDDGTVTLRFFLQIGTVNPGGASISQVKGSELVQLPIDTVDNDRVSSIVVAGHGQSVVMGGLISESASFQRSRVPGLGDIPALGMLFRKQDDKVERTETVVLITPHIMATPADAAGVSAGTLRRNSTHPWVRHDQAPLTVWDELDARLKAVEHPVPPAPGRTGEDQEAPAPEAGTTP